MERSSGDLAGSARLQFIPAGASNLPGSSGSYLEHVYPGIKAALASRINHLEIGRVALAERFQKQPHSLMALFRGGLLIAARSGYHLLHGLVSYNHFAYSDGVNSTFLSALMRPPYRRCNSRCHHRVIRCQVSMLMTSRTPAATSRLWNWRFASTFQRTSGFRCCCVSTST